jgi:nucleoside 2-deoxyribosyltransferase
MLVAVLEFLDPGTLIEIGMGLQKGMPVVVYDPHSLADNLMLTELPCCVTNDRNAVIRSVFEEASKLIK